ncbi:MAG: hypothetical protein IKN53_07205, partial [Oscillibacter sp.]|nr:hypothetical protein [Oscillibacter sp.]
MARKYGTTEYDDEPLAAGEDSYSLEEILAEYGAMREWEAETERTQEEARSASFRSAEEIREELPPEPKPLSLEDVVGHTVDAVMDEQREPLLQ